VAESLIERLASMPDDELAEAVAAMDEGTVARLLKSWALYRRPEQVAADWAWRYWAIVTGRGWGKNRTAAEWVLDRCEAFAKAKAKHTIGLFGRIKDDVHALQLGGESGLIWCAERRGWQVHAPESGNTFEVRVPLPDGSWHISEGEVHSSTDPDACRGRNLHTVWGDEFASWSHKTDLEGNTTWTNMGFGLRALCPSGMRPQAVVTTTPKPIPVVKELLESKYGPTHVTRGSLLDNRINLDESFVSAILGAFAGTRMERQEIHGEVVDSVEGALWDMELIARWRVRWDQVPDIAHICIGLDPSGSEAGDECGIVASGRAAERDTKQRTHGYVLEDASVRNRPAVWGPTVVKLHRDLTELFPHAFIEVVAETNYGGAMVVDTIGVLDPTIPVRTVTATRAKRVRAEPVATLYDSGRWHHVGVFPILEEQQCWWTPLEPTSPDRMDALVWSAHGLMPELTEMMSGYSPGFGDRVME
jgi:phage terminase large subunit-like protein